MIWFAHIVPHNIVVASQHDGESETTSSYNFRITLGDADMREQKEHSTSACHFVLYSFVALL